MPLADYCAKTLKVQAHDHHRRRHRLLATRLCAGFQRVFEARAEAFVQKLFPPLTVPDYGTYIAQLKTNVDGFSWASPARTASASTGSSTSTACAASSRWSAA